MWEAVFEVIAGFFGDSWGGSPSEKALAKDRARGRITAPSRTTSGRVPGLQPWWQAYPTWTVAREELRVGRRVLAGVVADGGARIPTSVEEGSVGTNMSVVTLRTADAVIEIALEPSDERWFRDRLAGVNAIEPS
ncbi:hypothetical protein [Demequina subtropica]|uniref:hypothetical protein n=1 Tax=Demequina subtropica TaxID=1638989 RepID=UPI000AC6AB57|nr:hypothetical protein [Demequina subtropica]